MCRRHYIHQHLPPLSSPRHTRSPQSDSHALTLSPPFFSSITFILSLVFKLDHVDHVVQSTHRNTPPQRASPSFVPPHPLLISLQKRGRQARGSSRLVPGSLWEKKLLRFHRRQPRLHLLLSHRRRFRAPSAPSAPRPAAIRGGRLCLARRSRASSSGPRPRRLTPLPARSLFPRLLPLPFFPSQPLLTQSPASSAWTTKFRSPSLPRSPTAGTSTALPASASTSRSRSSPTRSRLSSFAAPDPYCESPAVSDADLRKHLTEPGTGAYDEYKRKHAAWKVDTSPNFSWCRGCSSTNSPSSLGVVPLRPAALLSLRAVTCSNDGCDFLSCGRCGLGRHWSKTCGAAQRNLVKQFVTENKCKRCPEVSAHFEVF